MRSLSLSRTQSISLSPVVVSSLTAAAAAHHFSRSHKLHWMFLFFPSFLPLSINTSTNSFLFCLIVYILLGFFTLPLAVEKCGCQITCCKISNLNRSPIDLLLLLLLSMSSNSGRRRHTLEGCRRNSSSRFLVSSATAAPESPPPCCTTSQSKHPRGIADRSPLETLDHTLGPF